MEEVKKNSNKFLTYVLVLERFDQHLPFFKFKYDFNAFCYSKFLEFEHLYTLLIVDKGSSVFRTSSFSQASQDEPAVRDFVKPEGEKMR